jgi:hypothetical protein
LVIWPFGHLIWSFGHLVISPSGHLIGRLFIEIKNEKAAAARAAAALPGGPFKWPNG